MKKNIKAIEIETIDLNGLSNLNLAYYDNTIKTDEKITKVLGVDPKERYFKFKEELKERIKKALDECDDFTINFYENALYGNECELTTYKIKVESDSSFLKRKKKASESAKKSAAKRKELKEAKDLETYKALKKRFEK